MMPRILVFFAIVGFLLSFSSLSAQRIVGIKIGATNYQGDIVLENIRYTETNIGGGAFYQHFITRNIGIEGAINYIPLTASDWNYDKEDEFGRYTRGLQVNAQLFNFAIRGFYYPWNHMAPIYEEKKRNFQPFIGTGIDINYNLGDVQDLNVENGIQNVDAHDMIFAIPLTIGIRHYMQKNFAFTAEYTMAVSPVDIAIDGYNYKENSDWYHYVAISFNYTFI